MELSERVAELERRVAALEGARSEGLPPAADGVFWALEGLKAQLAEAGEAGEGGGVLFTGAVALPSELQYEWQYGLGTGELLEDGYDEGAAEALSALGHPVRLRLLREILSGRQTTAELTDLAGTGSTGQLYHHLRQLSAAGWLQSAGRGRYAVPGARVVPLLVVLAAARG
ncbi:ArsR/SmtB family transcription factor [Streptomyces boninensis]|uniref:ArsR/SmtB family transcription factor n=1 Tax=Streptomyces boninensis TaxID=2039455 RepID=UPI003B224720